MYIPLARRYRPQNFDEIVGQEHISKTLKNAITMDKLAHAYIFTGARGIGKTSTARIFAKGLNCEKGPTEKPCNECVTCQQITKGVSFDVLEIDGASNRGIDEIRNLRENVKLKPASGIYRIYIIDEVHMLTTEAFNALLKTLEEPPEHVKFMFATTRPHKVLPTILSRCQRFDFRMIAAPHIIEKLKEIAKIEKITIGDDALFLIAKNASGSLRDAEMMLDQLASFAKGKIAAQDISRIFGTLEQDAFIKISEAMLTNDGSAILKMIDELINSGREPMLIASSLVEHFRNLIVLSLSKDAAGHVLMGEDERNKLKVLSSKFSVDELFYAVYALSSTMDFIAKTNLGKIPLEITLLKLCRMKELLPIDEAMKKISQLENLLSGKQLVREEPKKNYVNPAPPDKIEPEIQEPNPQISKPALVVNEEPIQKSLNANLLRLKGIWPEVLREVKSKKMSIGSYLEEGVLLEIKDNEATIGFSKSNSLHKEVLDTKPNKDIITMAIKQLLGVELSVDLVSANIEVQGSEEEAVAAPIEERVVPAAYEKADPIIEAAAGIFNGRVIKNDFVKEENKK
ncbi:MAG: DNA polymerase III subunit gamma/tau [Candidatus Omnitrophica bacterium]|nr:DNA polymerase III subunit gamma/tau [Candidatus Omnitrophota bacterium]